MMMRFLDILFGDGGYERVTTDAPPPKPISDEKREEMRLERAWQLLNMFRHGDLTEDERHTIMNLPMDELISLNNKVTQKLFYRNGLKVVKGFCHDKST